jgi:hypothetical protein
MLFVKMRDCLRHKAFESLPNAYIKLSSNHLPHNRKRTNIYVIYMLMNSNYCKSHRKYSSLYQSLPYNAECRALWAF